jgi:hypothetical protein
MLLTSQVAVDAFLGNLRKFIINFHPLFCDSVFSCFDRIARNEQ